MRLKTMNSGTAIVAISIVVPVVIADYTDCSIAGSLEGRTGYAALLVDELEGGKYHPSGSSGHFGAAASDILASVEAFA